MHYYIDGYNLLFRMTRAGDNLQKQRQEIIQNLQIKINALDLDATLVFDAHYFDGEGITRYINRLEIIFTSSGESADEFIIKRLKEIRFPEKETVVTSDKKLGWLARRSHARTQDIEEFLSLLNRRYRNKLRERSPKKTLNLNLVADSKVVVDPSISESPPKNLEQTRPNKKATAEECFNWYMDIFDTSLKQAGIIQEVIVEGTCDLTPLEVVKVVRNAKKIKKTENSLESDFERWLKAFENNSHL